MQHTVNNLGNLYKDWTDKLKSQVEEASDTIKVGLTSWPFPLGLKPAEKVLDNLEELDPEVRVCYAHTEGYGGVTIAYRPTSNYKNTRMVEVAVVYCSPHEQFVKAKGRDLALANFEMGQTILVPAQQYGKKGVVHNLRNMFWNSI